MPVHARTGRGNSAGLVPALPGHSQTVTGSGCWAGTGIRRLSRAPFSLVSLQVSSCARPSSESPDSLPFYTGHASSRGSEAGFWSPGLLGPRHQPMRSRCSLSVDTLAPPRSRSVLVRVPPSLVPHSVPCQWAIIPRHRDPGRRLVSPGSRHCRAGGRLPASDSDAAKR